MDDAQLIIVNNNSSLYICVMPKNISKCFIWVFLQSKNLFLLTWFINNIQCNWFSKNLKGPLNYLPSCFLVLSSSEGRWSGSRVEYRSLLMFFFSFFFIIVSSLQVIKSYNFKGGWEYILFNLTILYMEKQLFKNQILSFYFYFLKESTSVLFILFSQNFK